MTDIVLIGGLWLPPRVWDDVVAELARLGHRGLPVALPGQVARDDGHETVTLDDQVAAVLAVVDACAEPPLVVGHSAAASLAWIAADRREPAGVVLIGGFPVKDGDAYADFLPIVDGVMPFPGWAAFEGPDAADLDADARAALIEAMLPVPEGVGPRHRPAARRAPPPGADHADLPRVHPGRRARLDRRRRPARTGEGPAAGPGRPGLRPLADGLATGGAGGIARRRDRRRPGSALVNQLIARSRGRAPSGSGSAGSTGRVPPCRSRPTASPSWAPGRPGCSRPSS